MDHRVPEFYRKYLLISNSNLLSPEIHNKLSFTPQQINQLCLIFFIHILKNKYKGKIKTIFLSTYFWKASRLKLKKNYFRRFTQYLQGYIKFRTDGSKTSFFLKLLLLFIEHRLYFFLNIFYIPLKFYNISSIINKQHVSISSFSPEDAARNVRKLRNNIFFTLQF